MMINSTPEDIIYALRQRILNAGIATLNNDFHGVNMPEIDPSGKEFWMEEFWGGYTSDVWTTLRHSMSACIMQYNLCVPIGTGTNMLRDKTLSLTNEFNIMDKEKSVVRASNIVGWVYRIVVKEDKKMESWLVRPVVLYLRLANV